MMVMLAASNYHIWKMKILDRLYVKRLTRTIAELGIRPRNTDIYEWSELDRRCLGYIRDYIDIGVIHHVNNETTASSTPDGTLPKELVCNSIINEKLRRETVKIGSVLSNNNETFVYESKKFNKKRSKQFKPKAKNPNINKKEDTCHYCNKKGHWKSQCYSFKKNQAEEGIKDDTLYKAKLRVQKGEVNIVEADMNLWHNRLRHMSGKGLAILSQNKSLLGCNNASLKDCTHYLMGKQHRVKFNKAAQRKASILELMY
ncbi:hypothetical protein LIER_27918 [Lithospermum erythrorhizon]|uniref:GAG-pre-integrase domain-containing protein n=1 Tax=Lithospermum erythrorhizon TaxID=34254 RepID=A0AAV3RDT2_LITER